MGLDFDISLAAGVLVVSGILFYSVLRKLSKSSNRYFSRIERRSNDVAIYLSHINEDRAHLEKLSKNKIDNQWAETHLAQAFSEFGLEKEERSKVKILIGAK